MDTDMWATSLPCDLLLDIFRRLGSASVISCAGVCKPWRRAIIDNTSCLWPRPDHFLPDLLLGFLDTCWRLTTLGHLEDVVVTGRSAESVLAMESVSDAGPYDSPLAMRDGFILLEVRGNTLHDRRLLLCNLIAGSRRFLPAAALGMPSWHSRYSYILITAYDDDGSPGGSSELRILAAAGEENWMTYQIFSTISGVWGPVKRSAKLIDEDVADMLVLSEPQSSVVCGGSIIYWLVFLFDKTDDEDGSSDRNCMFALDMRTERTWTTEVPEECNKTCNNPSEFVLATSEDGRQLYLVVVPESRPARPHINVWVLVGDDSRWTLKQTIDLQCLLVPRLPCRDQIWLRGFCARSGYLFVIANDFSGLRSQFLVGVDGSPSRQVGRLADAESWFVLPYEMDWSTYISNMKYF